MLGGLTLLSIAKLWHPERYFLFLYNARIHSEVASLDLWLTKRFDLLQRLDVFLSSCISLGSNNREETDNNIHRVDIKIS